jgi:hypothetical protein
LESEREVHKYPTLDVYVGVIITTVGHSVA